MHDETTIEAVRWRGVRELEKARDAAEDTLRQARDSHERSEYLASRAEEAIRDRNREEVGEWARSVLEYPSNVILSLGTTGLDDPIDIVEVVALGADGEAVFEERVRPAGYAVRESLDSVPVEVRRDPVPVSPGASSMHGHTVASLADAPTFAEIHPRLLQALDGKRVVVYNSAYVLRALGQTVERYRLSPRMHLLGVGVEIECAMERYARIEGTWSLEAETYGSVALPGRTGTPTGNARATLELLRELAGERAPVSSGSGGRGRRRGEDHDVNSEDFEDVPFRAVFPTAVRYPLV